MNADGVSSSTGAGASAASFPEDLEALLLRPSSVDKEGEEADLCELAFALFALFLESFLFLVVLEPFLSFLCFPESFLESFLLSFLGSFLGSFLERFKARELSDLELERLFFRLFATGVRPRLGALFGTLVFSDSSSAFFSTDLLSPALPRPSSAASAPSSSVSGSVGGSSADSVGEDSGAAAPDCTAVGAVAVA